MQNTSKLQRTNESGVFHYFQMIWHAPSIGLLLGLLLQATPLVSSAQVTESVSREVSVFNHGGPIAATEAISREFSIFNLGQPTGTFQAISREVSVLVTTNPLPDLAVAIADAPVSATAGGVAQLVFTITNSGEFEASGPWTNKFLLASSTNFLLAQTIGRVEFTNSIVLGASVTITQLVTLPITAYGDHYLGIEVDGDGNVVELVEGNNTAFTNIFIDYPSLPDLIPLGIASTNVVQAGQLLTISWGVTNDATATAAAPWSEQLLLANNPSGSNAIPLHTVTVNSSLAGSNGVVRAQSVIVPAGLSGNYWLGVQVDSGNQVFEGFGETNNLRFAAQPILIQSPDLVAYSMTVPSTVNFGQSFNVSWTVTNGGSGTAFGPWNDRLWLSASSNLIAGATLLATMPTGSPPLPAAGSYTNSTALTLPLNSQSIPGSYWLVMQADALGTVPESNENNNLNSLPLSVSFPSLSDLVPGGLTAPNLAAPGQLATLTYSVTNAGAVSLTNATWTEAVYLVSDAGLDATNVSNFLTPVNLVQTLPTTNSLAAGGFLVRTQSLAIPANSPLGNTRFVVVVDHANTVVESDEMNNSALADGITMIPAELTLQLPAMQLLEGTSMTATVFRNGSTAQPLVLTLSNDAPSDISFSLSQTTSVTTVTVPIGSSYAQFPVKALNDGVVDGSHLVNLTVSATNFPDTTASVTVLDLQIPSLALTLLTNSVTEGQTVGAIVTRDYVTTNALMVSLQSSSPSRLLTPSAVTIPPGSNSWAFALLASDNSSIELPTTVTVTATAVGFTGSSAGVSVQDNDTPTVSIGLLQTNITEGAGPQATLGTVSRFPASNNDLFVALSSSDPTRILVPSVVTIPSGQTSANFYVSAVNNTAADGAHSVTITPWVLTSASGVVVTSGTGASLLVSDDDGPSLTLVVAKRLVPEGQSPATTATVSRNTTATNALVVTLVSSATNEVTVPISTTIQSGQPSAQFDIASLNDGLTDGNKTVIITASVAGFSPGSDTLVVSDVNLPDLVASEVSGPANVDTETYFNVTYRVANQGVTPAGSNFLTRIFLSSDPVIGNDTLLGQYSFTGTIPPGLFFSQALQVQSPSVAGKYWVVVTTDVGESVAEVLENNNTTVSSQPINVAAAYGATVQADLDSAPAGTPVPMYGHATNSLGGAAAFKLVNIHIGVQGTLRIISAITDASGNFSTTWRPLPSEAGLYSLGADYPGVAATAVQDQFTLYGFKAEPASPSLTVADKSSLVRLISLKNQSDVALTAMAASVISKPANLTVSVNLNTNVLAGLATNILGYSITANDASTSGGTILVRITSSEGANLDIPISVTVRQLVPALVANPSPLQAGMARGKQAIVEFDVMNQGGAATGPLTVSLPDVPWLSLVTTNPMPSLAPGETNRITLQLMPATNLALGPYPGNLALNSSNTSLAVPFNFRCLSDGIGDLVITAVDEYTYYAAGAPKVTNAMVQIIDASTKLPTASGVTDSAGNFYVGGLNEGYYEVHVSATNHSDYHGTALVVSGETNQLSAFLSRQLVKYVWTVTPTEIEDRTRISIETIFETVVPAPVITVDPPLIDLANVNGSSVQINLTIANHGLIAANNFRLSFPSHPQWRFRPLIEEIGVLPANSSLTVPLVIERVVAGQPTGLSTLGPTIAALSAGDGPCSVTANACWTLLCGGKDNNYCATIQIVNTSGECGGPSNQPHRTKYVSTDPITKDPYIYNPVYVSSRSLCDCSFWPQLCLGAEVGMNLNTVLDQLTSKLLSKVPGLRVEAAELTFTVSGQICSCCYSNQLGWTSESEVRAAASVTLAGGPGISGDVSWEADDWASILISGDALLGVRGKLSGEVVGRLSRDCNGEPSLCLSGGLALEVFAGGEINGDATAEYVQDNVVYHGEVHGQAGLEGSLSVSIAGCVGENPRFEFCGSLHSRLNASGQLSAPGYDDKSFSASADVLLWDSGCEGGGEGGGALLNAYTLAGTVPVANGPVPVALAVVEPFDASGVLKSDAEILDTLGMRTQGDGVCAHVKLQLDQDLVIARDAFAATLELENTGPSFLSNILCLIEVRDASGALASAAFTITLPELLGISGVDGGGFLSAQSTGSAKWTLIPHREAANVAPTDYLIGGRLSYEENGNLVSVPLSYERVTVYPSPALNVKYFHERDVFSDDPFTDETEPSIPYSLAVLVENRGMGDARNVRIISAQPQVVDNEKGLLINFNLIATEVAGQNLQPSLTANFGEIGSGQIAIGRWLMTSTLQGLFLDYNATFQHADELGGIKTSLINEVTIHEMNHLVQAPGAFEDGKPDFLVNEVPDAPYDLPDTIYLSDGTTNSVAVVTNGLLIGTVTPSSLVVTQTAMMPPGWVYLRVPDPGSGLYRLASMVRSDGIPIYMNTNVWTTDRTFIGMGLRPIRENILHLLDYNSSGSYTLNYTAPPPPDTTAPTSSVAALPSESYPSFSVSWNGNDDTVGSGLAYFDIYASDDGGPFLPWLQHTTLRSAMYIGSLGHSYAFYSRATDSSGNVEVTPSAPQATTTVTKTNSTPTIGPISSITLNEGQTLAFDIPATDADNDTLTYSVLGSVPAGATLNPTSGRITWPTSEATGPTTNIFVFQVTDSGFPSLSSTGAATVTVNEVNVAPVLAAITNRIINEGFLLQITNVFSDADIPSNRLTFGLNTNAPVGASINASNGVFSWRPDSTQGPSTNLFTVTLTDDGVPPLSASRQFTVIVKDSLSDFTLSMGSTNVLMGESNTVPVVLSASLELTNVNLQLTAPGYSLTNLALRALSAEVSGLSMSSVSQDVFAVNFKLNPALQTASVRSVASLDFLTRSNFHSAIAPLYLSQLLADENAGRQITNGLANNGRIIIVGREPVLDMAGGNPMLLTLYGRPGATYSLLATTNLPNGNWSEFAQFVLTNRTFVSFQSNTSDAVFFRGLEVKPEAPNLTLMPASGSILSLQLNGWPGSLYGVETATQLNNGFGWMPYQQFVLTNSSLIVPWTNQGEAQRFFRGSVP